MHNISNSKRACVCLWEFVTNTIQLAAHFWDQLKYTAPARFRFRVVYWSTISILQSWLLPFWVDTASCRIRSLQPCTPQNTSYGYSTNIGSILKLLLILRHTTCSLASLCTLHSPGHIVILTDLRQARSDLNRGHFYGKSYYTIYA